YRRHGGFGQREGDREQAAKLHSQAANENRHYPFPRTQGGRASSHWPARFAFDRTIVQGIVSMICVRNAMSASVLPPDAHASRATRAFLDDLFACYSPRDFAVRFWDGSGWDATPGQPTRFTLVYNHPGAVRLMFRPPTLVSIGEAYIYQDYEVHGDFDAFF